jgi:hypothetical protein
MAKREMPAQGEPTKARRKKAAEPTKTCSCCKVEKPASAFWRDGSRKGGLDKYCAECRSSRNTRARKRGTYDPIESKACNDCRQVKPARDFYLERSKVTGLSCACKSCVALRQARHRSTHAGRAQSLLCGARTRARARGLPFDLTLEWVEGRLAAGACELTLEAFHFGKPRKGRVHPFAPSVDRIIPERGYTKKNCRIVVAQINLAINEFGQEAFKRLCLRYLMQSDPKLFVRQKETYSEPFSLAQFDLFMPNHVTDALRALAEAVEPPKPRKKKLTSGASALNTEQHEQQSSRPIAKAGGSRTGREQRSGGVPNARRKRRPVAVAPRRAWVNR